MENQGVPRAQLIEGFLCSHEFGETVSPVTRLYFAYFNRIPDYSGLMYWIGAYSSSTPLATISNAFAGSDAFTSTYGALNNSAFGTLVYQNVLGREPESSGITYWSGILDRSEQSRDQVMTGFSESTEYQTLMANQIYAAMTYIGLLRCSPDQGGFAYWVEIMDGGSSGLALIAGVLASEGYETPF